MLFLSVNVQTPTVDERLNLSVKFLCSSVSIDKAIKYQIYAGMATSPLCLTCGTDHRDINKTWDAFNHHCVMLIQKKINNKKRNKKRNKKCASKMEKKTDLDSALIQQWVDSWIPFIKYEEINKFYYAFIDHGPLALHAKEKTQVEATKEMKEVLKDAGEILLAQEGSLPTPPERGSLREECEKKPQLR
jgi:hypothetical protein